MFTAPALEVSEPTFWCPCEQLPTGVSAAGEAQAVTAAAPAAVTSLVWLCHTLKLCNCSVPLTPLTSGERPPAP